MINLSDINALTHNRTGDDDKLPIFLFDYKPGRSGDNPAKYLEGFKGFLHSKILRTKVFQIL